MTPKEIEITRFALSFLFANYESAFEDLEGDKKPTIQEVEATYEKFIAENINI
jgi:hypothetical protein